MLWLILLFPSNITGATKRHNVSEIWSWSGAPLDEGQRLLAILDHGVGSTGQAYSNRRDLELTFATKLFQLWKDTDLDKQSRLLHDAWEFGEWVDAIAEGDRRQFRHVILYLLFPDSYERIASGRHKEAIAQAFSNLAGVDQELKTLPTTNSARLALDMKLMAIRVVLQKEYPGQEIDFYEHPVARGWRPAAPTEDEPGHKAKEPVAAEARFWIEKTLVRGRADRERGEHRLGAALWSPQRARNGADIYSNMREVREGDVVLHLIDNKEFAGLSKVAGTVDDTFQGLPKTAWEGPAYRIQLRDYVPLDPPLGREEFLETAAGAAELRRVHEQYQGRGLFYTGDLV
jgi:hypothetical protein